MSDYNNYYENDNNDGFEWDDYIELDTPDFITLPPGDYDFEVVGFERGRFPGGAKLKPCNKAELTLQVKSDAGVARFKTDLLLTKPLEWKLSSFFRSIGQKKHGERLRMDWNAVPGAKGKCRVAVREYTDRNGNNRTANEVEAFYDHDTSNASNAPQTRQETGVGYSDDLPF